jgi:hypothetical protein
MNTAPVKDPVKRRNRSRPALEMALSMLTRNRLPVPLTTGVWPTGAQDRPAAASDPALPLGAGADGGIGLGQPAAHRGRVLLQGPPLRPLRAEPPAAQIGAHGGAGQQEAIALADQLGDGIAGPQKPRQAQLVRGRVTDQRDDLPLLQFREGGLLAWTAAAAPLSKPCPATLPVAVDPAVDGVVVDAEHPGGLGLSHAVEHRSDGPVAQRCLRCGRQ